MNLHDRIMELPTQDRHLEDWSNTRMAWLAGFDTGLHEAAQIAKEADELMAEMENAIDQMLGMYALKHCDDAMNSDECHSACELLERYNAWKENTK